MKVEKKLSDTKTAFWDGLKMVFTDSDPESINTRTDAVELLFSPAEQVELADFFDQVTEEMRKAVMSR